MKTLDGTQGRIWIPLLWAALLVIHCGPSFADDRVSLTGRVTDTADKPIEHATVVVYKAGVKKGYNLFCPTCYADCGKRTITNANGMFTFTNLSGDLWFELLAAADGYVPTSVEKVDPSSTSPVAAKLAPRPKAGDPSRIFRGHILDSQGRAVRDAVVQPVGALLDPKSGASTYGTISGLEPVAISNEKGEFEMGYSKLDKVLVRVDARAMAETFAVIPAGGRDATITVTEGATVRGRLVQDGKPVANAEVGLIGRQRGGFGGNLEIFGNNFDELRIGTQPDGTFAITNVPAPADWSIYGKMESLAARGATGSIACATKHDKEVVDVGDIQVKPAHHLRGRVVLSDGKPIPEGMRVTISPESAWDTQTAILPPDGRFEFLGLAAGSYSVWASVKGYEISNANVSQTVKSGDGSVTSYAPGVAPPFTIDRDVEAFVITLYPKTDANP
jgi:uncharacterized GH25 family protein